jgi:pre-mRNA-splicing factor CWC22
VYLPPQKLRALQAAITDRSTKEYQRMAWDALKKSINGLVNKINTGNIKFVVPELFGENLIRGRGLFCQSLLKAQHASLPFTPIYACLAAICNTKLPQVGELLVKRLIMRFRKAFKRNDKAVCLSSTMFIAHLVNNQVVHETLAAQILLLLLAKPTDDSVEIAVGLMREVGLFLEEMSPRITNAVFDQFRNILHEADIDRRTQYMIEVLFQVRKDKYKDNPVIKEELDLVEEDDQITHRLGLDDEINTQDSLNVFKFDPDWEANEQEYKRLKAEILGEGSDDEDDEDESESESEEDEEQKAIEIKDQSNTDLVNLRRTIYLTIQSSADPEEAAHKLMKLRLPPGQEPELVSMIVETCAQEKVYLKFMGLLGERFARLNRMWMDLFEESFMKYYTTIHRYETNKLRNIARFFGHLLASDSIGWHVFSAVHINGDETTSASRIFIKILFEDLQENMGVAKLTARMSDPMLQPSFQGIFPHDNPTNIRFAINYFTAIKFGYLTDEMRTYLANIPKPALPAPVEDSDSESHSSYSSYSRSSYSSRSRSRTPPRRAIDRGRSISRTPPRRGGRDDRSYSRSRSYTRSISSGRSLSRSPAPRRARGGYSPSRSRSPSRTRGGGRGGGRGRSYTRSLSRSPSRPRSPLPQGARGRPRSLSRSRSRSYSRSLSRSRSPLPAATAGTAAAAAAVAGGAGKRRREGSYSRSRSPAPPPARRLRRYSRSVSRSRSRSPVLKKERSLSRSLSPDRGLAVRGSRDGRPLGDAAVAAAVGGSTGGGGRGGRGRGYSYSRSLSRSRSRSRSPPPAGRGGGAAAGGRGGGRGGRGGRGGGGGYRDRDAGGYGGRDRDGYRGRRDSRSPVRSPPGGGGKRRRYHSSERSRSPAVPAKRGKVDG